MRLGGSTGPMYRLRTQHPLTRKLNWAHLLGRARKERTTMDERRACCSAAFLAVVSLTAVNASAQYGAGHGHEQGQGNPNPAVSPVQSRAYGLTYGEWSARWWEWAFSLPLDNSPLFGTADCSVGQSGHVWFLAGSPSPQPHCTVPAGTALFFPIINAECSTIPGDNTGDTTEAGLRSCADALANLIDPTTLNATMDGVPLTRLSQYRAQSPLFPIGPLPGPSNNNLGFYFTGNLTPAGTTGTSVGDGFYLMLHPLSAGPHVLHFHGEIPSFSFVVDMTYYLTVKP